MKYLIIILLFVSCTKETTYPEPKTNNILVIGASRVEGHNNLHNSFVPYLKNKLPNYNFIGNNQTNGANHEGHRGWTSIKLANNLTNWLSNIEKPDIVFISSLGGNDALSNQSYTITLQSINKMLEAIKNRNPNVLIVIEDMIRPTNPTLQITAYLDKLKEDIELIANSNDNISILPMSEGFTLDMYADNVHYNKLGAEFIANKYYNYINNSIE